VVSLPGYVSDMPELMAAADVFVLPSVEVPGSPREGLPVVIMEALASSCPVVTTAVSGNSEIVEDGVNGRLVPQHNPAALADAIVSVLQDPDRARLGENGRRIVEERFDLDRSVHNHAELFLRLIESRRR
jgi:glycosyltransferase involved in cell wall biosynthesis